MPSTNPDVVETVETLGQVAARQSIIVTWLQALLDEHGPDHRVVSVVRKTPFGSFLLDIREVEEEEPAASSLVLCANSEHGRMVAHPESPECDFPHFVAPSGPEPSMSAVETLDPREAEVGR